MAVVLLKMHIGLKRSSVVYALPVFCFGELPIPFFLLLFYCTSNTSCNGPRILKLLPAEAGEVDLF
jgi:hypothetical protein